jgi:hypothetical protein
MYYGPASHWDEFTEELDAICDQQLDEGIGEGLGKVRETLEFKMIDDP